MLKKFDTFLFLSVCVKAQSIKCLGLKPAIFIQTKN